MKQLDHQSILIRLSFVLLVTTLVAACGNRNPTEETDNATAVSTASTPESAADSSTTSGDEHEEEVDEHAEDGHSPAEHMAGSHGVPEDAAAVANPIATTDESIAAGMAIYAQNCAVCHGENGTGDGPGAAALDPKPADFHAEHVQSNSDGALFWIITHGREDTAMPPWDNALSEEERWHLVNFLRTFAE